MNTILKWMAGAGIGAIAAMVSTVATADDAAGLMKSRLGTTAADPVIAEAFERAARPVTPELRAKAIECWNNSACDTGTGGLSEARIQVGCPLNNVVVVTIDQHGCEQAADGVEIVGQGEAEGPGPARGVGERSQEGRIELDLSVEQCHAD